MENERLEALLEVFPRLAEAVNSFASPDVQRDAFGVLSSVALGEQPVGEQMSVVSDVGEERAKQASVASDAASAGVAKDDSGSKPRKKNTAALQIDPDLNIRPQGQLSLLDYADEKKPASLKEKSMVIVSWLEEKAGHNPTSIDQIFTCYKAMKWRLPSNLKNHLQTLSAHEQWLRTSDSNSITLTTLGSQFVEHDLPRKTN